MNTPFELINLNQYFEYNNQSYKKTGLVTALNVNTDDVKRFKKTTNVIGKQPDNVTVFSKLGTAIGTKCFNEAGQLHNENGPAVDITFEAAEYYVNGKRHRLDGPAIVPNSDSVKKPRYFINDVEYFNSFDYEFAKEEFLNPTVTPEQSSV